LWRPGRGEKSKTYITKCSSISLHATKCHKRKSRRANMQRDFYTVKACTQELLRPASVTVDPTDIQKNTSSL
jgi:hypothetical protein